MSKTVLILACLLSLLVGGLVESLLQPLPLSQSSGGESSPIAQTESPWVKANSLVINGQQVPVEPGSHIELQTVTQSNKTPSYEEVHSHVKNKSIGLKTDSEKVALETKINNVTAKADDQSGQSDGGGGSIIGKFLGSDTGAWWLIGFGILVAVGSGIGFIGLPAAQGLPPNFKYGALGITAGLAIVAIAVAAQNHPDALIGLLVIGLLGLGFWVWEHYKQTKQTTTNKAIVSGVEDVQPVVVPPSTTPTTVDVAQAVKDSIGDAASSLGVSAVVKKVVTATKATI